ncbi:hypothetical protein [Streptomyces sp. NPDC059491]|uniref:hypothetical protein n=1 Tax=Streptomyces sp. NPDC059491 TaxID=3346850 RepID=UPI0036C76F0D
MTTHSPTQEPTKTGKVMAIIIAILSGTVAALVAHMITRHLGSTLLVGVGCSGVSFGAVLGIVKRIEEMPGLLRPPALRPRQHLVGAPPMCGARPALTGALLAIDEARPSVRSRTQSPGRPQTGRGCNHSLQSWNPRKPTARWTP